MSIPKTSSASCSGGAVSVVKVISTSAGSSANSTVASQGLRIVKATEPLRKVETLCKQEKANRIVAEAIARAKARGERNIPRVLSQDEFPARQTSIDLDDVASPTGAKKKSAGGNKKKSPALSAATVKAAVGEKKVKVKSTGSAVAGGGGGCKSKGKTKPK